MQHFLSLLTLIALTGLAVAQTAAAAVAVAARDVMTLPPGERPSTRYLFFATKPTKLSLQVLSGHINSLSREPDLVPPFAIEQGGVTLLRLQLKDYRWNPEIYFKLSEQAAATHVPVTNGHKEYVLAPWLAETPEQVAALELLTKETVSQVPVLRADYFVWATAIQNERVVGYYGLLEVKNRNDFFKAVGFDPKASKAFAVEALAAVSRSGVARQPRRIARYEKLGGGIWFTFDNEEAKDRANPLRVLNEDFTHKAEELYAHLANGLWAVHLNSDQGEQQKSAPDFIGFDSHAHSNDGRINSYLSCVRCHSDGGLQPIDNWAKGLFPPPPPPGLPPIPRLVSPDAKIERDLRQRYVRRLDVYLEDDRRRYARALHDVCGLTPAQYAAGLSRVFADYDRPVSRRQAAEEAGVTEEVLTAALGRYAVSTGRLDTVLQSYVRVPPESIGRDAFDEAFPLLMLSLRGLVPVEKVKP